MRAPSTQTPSSEPSQSTAASSLAHGRPVSRYAVYWTPPSRKRLLLLHFPNRDRTHPYNARAGQAPRGLRLKPRAGLVELDVPLPRSRTDPERAVDAARAVRYGAALRESAVLRRGGAFGMAGGFAAGGLGAVGPPTARGGAVAAAAAPVPDGAARQGADDDGAPRAMDSLTLGGRVRAAGDGDPIYAVGVFRGDELHLTRVSAVCALQPQLHHLDALADNERATRRAAAAAAARDAEDGGAAAPEPEARAVNLAIKGTDEEELDVGGVGTALRAMQEEKWEALEWVDEDDQRAYELYKSDLVLADEGKRRTLVAELTPTQYLDAISAPKMEPTALGNKVLLRREGDSGDESEEVVEVKEEEDVSTSKAKGKR